MPRKPQNVLLAPYLLLVAASLFLAEVLQRRTGLLTIEWRLAAPAKPRRWLGRRAIFRFGRRNSRELTAPTPLPGSDATADRSAADRPLQAEPHLPPPLPPLQKPAPAAKAVPAPPQPAPPPADGMGDALAQAQKLPADARNDKYG